MTTDSNQIPRMGTPWPDSLRGLDGLPRIELATLPTPVRPLAELGRAWGVGDLWLKDDGRCGPLYGGNKVRKLEYLLGEARAAKSTSIVTIGAIGSHHSLATTLYGKQAGFEVEAGLFPQPLTDHVRANLAANLWAGVRPSIFPSPILVPLALLRRRWRQNWTAIPGGGSSAEGVTGFVAAAFELADQVRSGALPEPSTLFVALGTGGTAAGLVLGLRLAGLSTRVVCVRVIDRAVGNGRTVARLANRTATHLRRWEPAVGRPRFRAADIDVEHGQFGRGYGHPTPAAVDAAKLAADLGEFEVETTYTAKALAGIPQRARQGRLEDGPVLFWNTVSAIHPDGYDPSGANVARRLPERWRSIYSCDT